MAGGRPGAARARHGRRSSCQVNGKVRDRIEVAAGRVARTSSSALARERAQRAARTSTARQVVKEVVVPGQLVNFVVALVAPAVAVTRLRRGRRVRSTAVAERGRGRSSDGRGAGGRRRRRRRRDRRAAVGVMEAAVPRRALARGSRSGCCRAIDRVGAERLGERRGRDRPAGELRNGLVVRTSDAVVAVGGGRGRR